MEAHAPSCFTQAEWRDYTVACSLSARHRKGALPTVDHCRDCTQQYKRKMHDEGKCDHPETVFIKADMGGDVIGVAMLNPVRPHVWEQALMGVSGVVVGMPPASAIDAAMSLVAKLAVKRKPGRPRKD